MIISDKDTYFQILDNFEIIPYTQSRGWYDMLSLYKPDRIKFFVNDISNPTIACIAHEKTFLGIKMILIEGEAYKDSKAVDLNNIRSYYRSITETGYPIIEVASNATYNFDYETAMRQAGYLRPVGIFSLSSTKIINLKSYSYDSNWRYYVKKSLNENLDFEIKTDVSEDDIEEFITIYNDMMKLKSISPFFDKHQLNKLLEDKHFQLFFMSFNGVKISAIITYQIGPHASLLYAANDAEGRKHFSSFALYDSVLKYYHSQDIQTFDMEKLLPSTDEVNGVFKFKNGISGTHIQLNGEWSWYGKSFYRPAMYFVKKYLIKKREL